MRIILDAMGGDNAPGEIVKGAVDAVNNVHQGALAGAVFAHQTQHLALFQGEVDVCEHLIAEKALFDIPHLKQRSIVLFHIHPYL